MFDYTDNKESDESIKIIKFTKKSNKNIKYLVQMKEFQDYLNIKIISEDKILYKEYEKKFYLTEIIRNKPLSYCKNISEVINSLEQNLKIGNVIELVEDENTFFVKIVSHKPSVNEIIFSIPKVKREKSIDIKDLINIINKQQLTINKLCERVTYLEEKEKERQRKEEGEQFFLSNNSTIINGDKEKDIAIRRWINPRKKDFNIKLLFRMSLDGNHSSSYHKLCDNKDNLLTIIETDNNLKFGGFASKSWGVQDQYIEKAFLFSLNHMKKYERLNYDNSKWDGSAYGPVFGNAWDIYINSEMTTGRERYNSDSVFFKKHVITNNGYFSVREIEVFQIE